MVELPSDNEVCLIEPVTAPDTRQEVSDVLQIQLFSFWFNTIITGFKRREYKVPGKILNLPCGCQRERSHEGEINNAWHIKRKGSVYSHRQCGKVFKKTV